MNPYYFDFNKRIVARPSLGRCSLIRTENVTERVGVRFYRDEQTPSPNCAFFDVGTGREFVREINVVDVDEYLSAALKDTGFLDWLERVRTLPTEAELPDVQPCLSDTGQQRRVSARPHHEEPYVEDGVLLSPNGIDITLDDDYWTGHYWTMKRREKGLFAGLNRIETLSTELTEQVDREREERERALRERNEPHGKQT